MLNGLKLLNPQNNYVTHMLRPGREFSACFRTFGEWFKREKKIFSSKIIFQVIFPHIRSHDYRFGFSYNLRNLSVFLRSVNTWLWTNWMARICSLLINFITYQSIRFCSSNNLRLLIFHTIKWPLQIILAFIKILSHHLELIFSSITRHCNKGRLGKPTD